MTDIEYMQQLLMNIVHNWELIKWKNEGALEEAMAKLPVARFRGDLYKSIEDAKNYLKPLWQEQKKRFDEENMKNLSDAFK